jgi:hypothetical protein
MTILELLKEHPSIEGALIALFSGISVIIIQNILQFLIEKAQYKKELRTFFWKEKINSAKKASEFYLEQMNYFNLLIQQFEIFESGQIKYNELYENLNKEIEYYSNKLKSFPHFEHHHINIFYDFNDKRSMELNKRTFDIIKELIDLQPKKEDSNDDLDKKLNQIKIKSSELKDNYNEHFEIYKKILKEVQNDIKKYL